MSFDIKRLRTADQIVGGGAIAFFIILFFFKWYGVSVSSSVSGLNIGGISSSATGWDAFTNSRWIWLLTIIVALGAVALIAAQRKLEIPVQPSVIVTGLGALSTLFIIYRIVHHPTASGLGFHAGIKIGIWLGLISAAAITYGGYLAMRAEGTSLADVREQASQAMSSVTSSEGSSSGGTGGSAPTAAPPAPAAPAPPPPSTPPATSPPIPPPVAPSTDPTPGEGGSGEGPSSSASF